MISVAACLVALSIALAAAHSVRRPTLGRLMIQIVACALLIAAALLNVRLAHGGSYYNGTVRDGYTFNNGYWYQGKTPYYSYAHTAYNYVPTYAYNSYGGYSTYYSPQAYTYYTYEQAPYEQPKAAAPTAPAGWKTELLNLAGKRDDYLAYLNALKALGLPQPLQSPYPAQQQAPAPGYAPAYNNVPYAMNANTLYGYSYSTVKDVYGDTNLNTLYQQAARLTQNAQSLAGQAQGDFSSLVQQEGGNRSRVAEILAKAQAAAAALKAAEAAPGVHVESRASATVSGASGTTTTEGSPIEVQPGAAPQQQYSQPQAQQAPQAQQYGQPQARAFADLLQNRCASCHSGKDPAGKLTLTPETYGQMSLSDKARVVWPRLTHPDPHKRMPRGDKAQPLSPEELRMFYNH